MIIQSHDGLEIALYVLGLIGATATGVIKWAYNDIIKKQESQWNRIDELKDKSVIRDSFEEWRHRIEAIEKDYISRDYHEQFRKEFKEDVQNAITNAIAPLKVAIENLTSQLRKE